MPGWYQVQCYGFVQSDNNHDAYLFAKVASNDETTPRGGESRVNLKKVAPGTFNDKNVEDSCVRVGTELTLNGEKYKNTLWICVTDEQFNSGNDLLKTLQIGVGKDEATRSTKSTINNVACYYDTDWVCIDDIRVSYMGLGPVFFYEDEEDLEYLRFDENNIKQYQSAAPDGQYSGAACLERTLKKDQWNSFSFPLPLTGEQMRLAFGEHAKLAKIHSVGKLSQNPDVIDFHTVSLRTTDYVVEPGQFYLLQPSADPVSGIDPRGLETTFYELGRMFFSVNENEPPSYTHPKMSLDTMMVSTQDITSLNDSNNGIASVIYVQTPGYQNFTVSDGTYTGTDADGLYAPNGAYVVSNNTIYHINKDTRLKGFRGWITPDHPIPPANNTTMTVFGRYTSEGEQTSIELHPMTIMHLSSETSVYDLCGRKVGEIGMHLPKGIYIGGFY